MAYIEHPLILMFCDNPECRVVSFRYGPNDQEPGIPYRDGSCPSCGNGGNRR